MYEVALTRPTAQTAADRPANSSTAAALPLHLTATTTHRLEADVNSLTRNTLQPTSDGRHPRHTQRNPHTYWYILVHPHTHTYADDTETDSLSLHTPALIHSFRRWITIHTTYSLTQSPLTSIGVPLQLLSYCPIVLFSSSGAAARHDDLLPRRPPLPPFHLRPRSDLSRSSADL